MALPSIRGASVLYRLHLRLSCRQFLLEKQPCLTNQALAYSNFSSNLQSPQVTRWSVESRGILQNPLLAKFPGGVGNQDLQLVQWEHV